MISFSKYCSLFVYTAFQFDTANKFSYFGVFVEIQKTSILHDPCSQPRYFHMILARSWASGSLSFLTDVWLHLIVSNMRFDLLLVQHKNSINSTYSIWATSLHSEHDTSSGPPPDDDNAFPVGHSGTERTKTPTPSKEAQSSRNCGRR